MKKRIKAGFNVLVDFWWGHGIAYQVPALAFYILVSLAPLALGLVALGGLIYGDVLRSASFADQLSQVLPDQLDSQIAHLVKSASRQSPLLLVVSLCSMCWLLSAALGVIERTMSAILEGPGFGIVWGRIRLILVSLGLCLLIVSEAAITTLGSSAGESFASFAGVSLPDLSLALPLVTVCGTFLICALIFLVVPSRPARFHWWSIIEGAAPAAVIMQLCPWLVSRYFSLAHFSTAGVFLSLAVVMTSCFLLATGLCLGAGIAAAREKRFLDAGE